MADAGCGGVRTQGGSDFRKRCGCDDVSGGRRLAAGEGGDDEVVEGRSRDGVEEHRGGERRRQSDEARAMTRVGENVEEAERVK